MQTGKLENWKTGKLENWKTGISFAFFLISTTLNFLSQRGICQDGQWNTDFPYPTDFPASGQGVTISGAGDAGSPFIATYTYTTPGGAIATSFTVTHKIIYEYQQFTTSNGVLCRRKLRSNWDNFPQSPSFIERERSGFTELITNQPSANSGPSQESIKTTYHDWDHVYNPSGGIVLSGIAPKDNTNYASRILSFSQSEASATYKSHRTRVYNSRFPLLFSRDEEIAVTYLSFANSWALYRKYKSAPFVDTEQTDGDLWPNSSGLGSSFVPQFNLFPPTELNHWYGPDVLTRQDAYEYEYELCFGSVPWSNEPF
jgi:hypothetical protein